MKFDDLESIFEAEEQHLQDRRTNPPGYYRNEAANRKTRAPSP
jgi:hypothetical protein